MIDDATLRFGHSGDEDSLRACSTSGHAWSSPRGTAPSNHTPITAGLFARYGIATKGNTAYVTTGAVAVGARQVIKIGL